MAFTVRKFSQWLAENVNGIIPIMYDYWVGYQGFPNPMLLIADSGKPGKIKYQGKHPETNQAGGVS